MRLQSQIRAAACCAWVGVLGMGVYIDMNANLSVTDSPRLSTPRKAGAIFSAQYRLMPADTVLPEPRVFGRWDAKPSDGSAQGISPGFASESLRDVSFLSARLAGSSDRNAGAVVARSQGVSLALSPEKTKATSREPGRGFQPYVLTGYSHGCILPKWGPEPPPQPMASGEWPVAGLHVAGPPEMAFGTVLEVVYKGLPSRLIVGDRGRAIKGRRLDLFLATCRAARAWGRRTAYVREVSE